VPGSKFDRARELGVKVIDEEEFKRLTVGEGIEDWAKSEVRMQRPEIRTAGAGESGERRAEKAER
jgi:BRCT domain type II-containing protein